MTAKKSVLFVCTHNSARSQMAEGYLNSRYGDQYEAFSAGTEPGALHQDAVQVMSEIGVDISNHHSKPLIDFFDKNMDIAVTVCDTASGACPMVPGAKEVIHQGFEDPVPCIGDREECLGRFRKVRDEICTWIDYRFG